MSPLSQICAQRVARGHPKRGFGDLWGALGRLRASPGALVTASGANVWPCDKLLRTKTFSRPKPVPTRLPKSSSAANAQDIQGRGKTHVWLCGECFRVGGKPTIQQKHSFAASKSN